MYCIYYGYATENNSALITTVNDNQNRRYTGQQFTAEYTEPA